MQPSAARRARERAEMSDRILDAARELFAEHGYEAVTMRRIADSIEYTATTLYSYFDSKEDILRALCEREFTNFTAVMSGWTALPCPVARLLAAGRMYLQFALDHPNHFRFMFMTKLPDTITEEDVRAFDPNRNSYQLLRQMVADVQGELGFREPFDDIDLTAQTTWAAVHGLACLAVSHHHDAWVQWKPIDQRADAMLFGVLGGMLKPEVVAKLRAENSIEGVKAMLPKIQPAS